MHTQSITNGRDCGETVGSARGGHSSRPRSRGQARISAGSLLRSRLLPLLTALLAALTAGCALTEPVVRP